ncbi:MAG: ATP-binding protein [Nocardioides sp.]|uniref:sensor histidine kinase n=1 Tax=Nocardioides sp. TaxID=35761 RepID=UPI0039E66D4A
MSATAMVDEPVPGWRRYVDHPNTLIKQTPTVVLLFCSVLLVAFVPHLAAVEPAQAITGVALVALATAVAALLSTSRIDEGQLTLVVPILDLIGLGLFRAGTGGSSSLFSALILVPVVWLAAAPGARQILVVAVLTAIVLLIPYLTTPPTTGTAWLRSVTVPAVYATVAAVINELSRQQRTRAHAAEELAAERSAALSQNIDILARLQASEQRYRELLATYHSMWEATTSLALISTDADGLVMTWNPGATNLFGHSLEEAVGRLRIADILPDAEQRIRELLVLANNDLPADCEIGIVAADERLVPARLTVTPRRDASGEQLGYLLVVLDETKAAEVARLKDEFIGMISHELRTPLSSIIGYVDLLQHDPERPPSDEQRDYLVVVERNARRLLKLVGDLLFTTQVESGRFALDPQEVDLHDVVDAAIASARPAALAAGVDLVADIGPEPTTVSGDPVRLGQAVDNLISNAVKFSTEGGAVTVTLAADAETATITVRDTGIGIPSAEIAQLYSRFFRASTATRHAVPGVGLGLSITRAVVLAHGGRLDVSSDEGVGTEFRIVLPR